MENATEHRLRILAFNLAHADRLGDNGKRGLSRKAGSIVSHVAAEMGRKLTKDEARSVTLAYCEIRSAYA